MIQRARRAVDVSVMPLLISLVAALTVLVAALSVEASATRRVLVASFLLVGYALCLAPAVLL